MANILYLVHRIPFPPNKGDKVRSYHLLRHLLSQHRVFLGTFVDDPDDHVHVEMVRQWCAGSYVAKLRPVAARIGSLRALWQGLPLTVAYYGNKGLADWCKEVLETESIDAVVVFSSSMAQFATSQFAVPVLVDFVDVDSAKWQSYAAARTWPLSWLYRREGDHLLAYDRELAMCATSSFFVTAREAELFLRLAPECKDRVECMGNGVDSAHFAPDASLPSPFDTTEIPLVFTGAMDYWPNIDAVAWFTKDVLPHLRAQWPSLRFHIVGRNPAPSVQALSSESVVVSGTVPDVRPYLQHAAAVVAPLRLARGIQNKILEAMAMARPVVAASVCAQVIAATEGVELLTAGSADDYEREITSLLSTPAHAAAVGAAARKRVLESFSWSAHLSVLDRHLGAMDGDRMAA